LGTEFIVGPVHAGNATRGPSTNGGCMRKHLATLALAVGLLVSIASATAFATNALDFGSQRDQTLANEASKLFGVKKPIAEASTDQITQAAAAADPTKLVTLAKGLQAHVVTTQGPAVDDQISLWPDDRNPTYLIECNEQGPSSPGLVRIQL